MKSAADDVDRRVDDAGSEAAARAAADDGAVRRGSVERSGRQRNARTGLRTENEGARGVPGSAGNSGMVARNNGELDGGAVVCGDHADLEESAVRRTGEAGGQIARAYADRRLAGSNAARIVAQLIAVRRKFAVYAETDEIPESAGSIEYIVRSGSVRNDRRIAEICSNNRNGAARAGKIRKIYILAVRRGSQNMNINIIGTYGVVLRHVVHAGLNGLEGHGLRAAPFHERVRAVRAVDVDVHVRRQRNLHLQRLEQRLELGGGHAVEVHVQLAVLVHGNAAALLHHGEDDVAHDGRVHGAEVHHELAGGRINVQAAARLAEGVRQRGHLLRSHGRDGGGEHLLRHEGALVGALHDDVAGILRHRLHGVGDGGRGLRVAVEPLDDAVGRHLQLAVRRLLEEVVGAGVCKGGARDEHQAVGALLEKVAGVGGDHAGGREAPHLLARTEGTVLSRVVVPDDGGLFVRHKMASYFITY